MYLLTGPLNNARQTVHLQKAASLALCLQPPTKTWFGILWGKNKARHFQRAEQATARWVSGGDEGTEVAVPFVMSQRID